MTQPGNLFSTYDAASSVPGGSIKESVLQRIFNNAPSETPFLNGLPKSTAKNRKHEWLEDTLDTASGVNIHAEGSDFAGTAITAATRKSNICQISKKEFVVSETMEAVDKIGRDSEVSYQYLLKMKALKTDMETSLLQNNAAVDTGESTERELGGAGAWFTTNVSRGSGGSSGSNGTTAATNGTQRALTETMLLTVAQSIYDNSGVSQNMKILTPTFNKKVIAGFSGSGTRTFDAMEKKVSNDVLIYETPFEQTFRVQLDRFMPAREVHFYQMDYAGLAYLRPIKRVRYDKDGDNQKHGLVVEYTLEMRSQKTCGIIADLTTS